MTSQELQRSKTDKSLLQKSLETAESNIEILNETLEYMSNENIHYKGTRLNDFRSNFEAERGIDLQKKGERKSWVWSWRDQEEIQGKLSEGEVSN